MPRLAVAHTAPQVELLTRTALLEALVRETGIGVYGTATSGSTSTLVDTTALQSTGYLATDWQNGWAYISYDGGGAAAAPEGEIRPITTYAPSSGTITVSPNWTIAPASTDKYILFRYPHPQIVLDTIDDILTEELWMPTVTALSELPDYDMENSGVTHWGTASNVTASKVSTAPELMGKRWLSLATTSANGYLPTKTVTVEPSTTYYISALVRCSAASTTAALIVYDETNSAAITPHGGALTTTRQYVHRLYGTFTTPSTCHQITIRLSNQENAVTSYWDEVILYAIGDADIALPSWVRNPDQVLGIMEMAPQGVNTNLQSNLYRGWRSNDWEIPHARIDTSGQLRAVSRFSHLTTRPLFIYGLRNEEAFSNNNTDYKHVPQNFLIAAAAFKVFQRLSANPISGTIDQAWITTQRELWRRKYDMEKYAIEETIWDIRRSGNDETYVNVKVI